MRAGFLGKRRESDTGGGAVVVVGLYHLGAAKPTAAWQHRGPQRQQPATCTPHREGPPTRAHQGHGHGSPHHGPTTGHQGTPATQRAVEGKGGHTGRRGHQGKPQPENGPLRGLPRGFEGPPWPRGQSPQSAGNQRATWGLNGAAFPQPPLARGGREIFRRLQPAVYDAAAEQTTTAPLPCGSPVFGAETCHQDCHLVGRFVASLDAASTCGVN